MSDGPAPKQSIPLATWVAIGVATLAFIGAGGNIIWNNAFLRSDVNALQTGQASRASKDEINQLHRDVGTKANTIEVQAIRDIFARYVIDTRRELDEMKAAGWGDKISSITATLARIDANMSHVLQRLGSSSPSTDRPTPPPSTATARER